MKIPFSRLSLAAAAVPISGCAAWQQPRTVEVNLVALNDLHGHLEPTRFTYTSVESKEPRTVNAGGIVTLAGALKEWRRQDSELLLVGAGDLIGATPALSSMWADEPTLAALDMLGLSVTSVGNHEFDQGRVELLRQQNGGCDSPRADKACKYAGPHPGAKFSYLAANVVDTRSRKPILPAYRILESKGVKIAFIGTVLKDTAEVVAASGIAGLEFIDEADAVNRLLPELRRQGAGVFVVLIHQGGRTKQEFDKRYCSDLEGDLVPVVKRLDPAIRLIISGHSHKGYLCDVDGRIVTQAQMGGHMLSRIKLTVDREENKLTGIDARNVVMTEGEFFPDGRAEEFLKQLRERSTRELAKPVAHIGARQISRERKAGAVESPLGRLVADATLFAGRPFGAQIAFMNVGGIRQSLEAGEDNLVNLGQVQAVLPFGNTLVVMNLTGAQIRTLLEQQWVSDKADVRGILQVSEGFSYRFDLRRPEGERVIPGSITLNGVPLEDNASYRIAVNAFLAEGGDAFPMFTQGSNRVETGLRDTDSFARYLVKREQDKRLPGAVADAPRIQHVKE
jgi:5'-nucleotidase